MYTFGPINSRRFGLSLGIDLSPNIKSCNYDCVYCELEGAKPTNIIPNPPLVEDIIKDLKDSLNLHPEVEVITITSNGEPTLYKDLKLLVSELNKIKEDKKILILSNGSNVSDALLDIDIVKLSLDCATKKCFKKIDRPLKNLDLENIISNMISFSQKFKNTLVIEVLLVEGVNDKEDEIKKIDKLLHDIKPHRVDLGTIDRPPAYQVRAVTQERLFELSKLFIDLPISIIHKNPPKIKEKFSKEEILTVLSRRPQSQFDIDSFFSKSSKDYLDELIDEGRAGKVNIAGTIFFKKLSS